MFFHYRPLQNGRSHRSRPGRNYLISEEKNVCPKKIAETSLKRQRKDSEDKADAFDAAPDFTEWVKKQPKPKLGDKGASTS